MITFTINPNDTTSYVEDGDVVITAGQATTLTFTSNLGTVNSISSTPALPTGLSVSGNTITGTVNTKQPFTDYVLTFNTGEQITIHLAVIGNFDFRKLKDKNWNFYNYHKTESATITISNTLDNTNFNPISFTIPPLTVLKFTFSVDGIYKAFVQLDGAEFYHIIYEFSDIDKCYSDLIRKFFTECNCSTNDKMSRIYNIMRLMALKQTFSFVLNPLFNQKLLYSTNAAIEVNISIFMKAMDIHAQMIKICESNCCNCNCK